MTPKILKTLKTMFKALDLKGDRDICKNIFCKYVGEGNIAMVATNGHILLKTIIPQSDLEVLLGPIPAQQFFSIKPDKVKKAVYIEEDGYFNTIMRVVPDLNLLEREYSWTAFDPDYLQLATEFLSHNYGAKFRTIRPYVLSTGNTLSPHLFGDISGGTWALIMPLKIED